MLSGQQALLRTLSAFLAGDHLAPADHEPMATGWRKIEETKDRPGAEVRCATDQYALQSVVSRPWASATFEGQVHEIRLRHVPLAGPQVVRDAGPAGAPRAGSVDLDAAGLLDALSRLDLSHYGHVLIDLNLRSVAIRWVEANSEAQTHLVFEALTIVD